MFRISRAYATLSGVKLSSLDFNLLRTLDAVLQESSVTRAAERLEVSQPAVSLALAKLRRHFNDELLRRAGNRYELTPMAVQLRERAAVAMLGVKRVFEAQPTFDPTVEEREFTLLVSDYAIAVLGSALRILTHERAPGIVLRMVQHKTADVDHAHETVRTVDGLVVPHGFVSGLPYTELFSDGWMGLVSTSNRHVVDELTMDHLAQLPWAFTYLAPTAFTPAGRQLQTLGVEAHVEVVVESFLALPHVVAGTDRIALVQSRLADRMTRAGDVRALPLPFDALPITEAMWWHPMYDRDPAHVWLRALLVEACQSTSIPPQA
jgi:DNA-binding transcriptional LysR family regulator